MQLPRLGLGWGSRQLRGFYVWFGSFMGSHSHGMWVAGTREWLCWESCSGCAGTSRDGSSQSKTVLHSMLLVIRTHRNKTKATANNNWMHQETPFQTRAALHHLVVNDHFWHKHQLNCWFLLPKTKVKKFLRGLLVKIETHWCDSDTLF